MPCTGCGTPPSASPTAPATSSGASCACRPHHDGGPLPVAVLVHGGYWRSIWAADLMDALAVDLAQRGYAAWNLEYRRPDRHGWQATVADVAAGLDRLTGLGSPGPPPRSTASRSSATRREASSPGAPPPTRPGSRWPSPWPEWST